MSFYACFGSHSQKNTISENSTYSVATSFRSRVNSVFELENDSISYAWHGGDIVWLYFSKGKVDFPFSVSCGISLPTQIISNKKIIFFWDLSNLSCTYDIGLRRTFGLSHTPVIGEPFGEFILVNDTLLKVNYYFPEWVERIIAYRETDIFPNQFVLDPRIFSRNVE